MGSLMVVCIVVDLVHDIEFSKFQVESPTSKSHDKTNTWSW